MPDSTITVYGVQQTPLVYTITDSRPAPFWVATVTHYDRDGNVIAIDEYYLSDCLDVMKGVKSGIFALSH